MQDLYWIGLIVVLTLLGLLYIKLLGRGPEETDA
jgi:hypothetical protein